MRRGRPADHARVARLLTGRGVGLTLGGGGPRGFAHVGVLRAFDDVGLPVDAVGGTSIGAIMAGFVGLGWDQSTLEAKVHEAFVTSGKVVDRTLPLVSLASARRLESLLHDDRFFGDTAVEDLWVPWFAISTNLSRADVVVHDRGPAWRAIRASISLPGVFPPVWHHGDVLVDGGVLNNLPLDVMADRLGGGVHVAVDLEPPVDLRIPTAFPSAISGWQVALRRLRGSPSTARIPGPLEVLLRSRGVGSRSALRSVRTDVEVDLMLSPPVDGYGPLDFTVAAELIERGHRYTLERLADVDGRVRALLSEAAR